MWRTDDHVRAALNGNTTGERAPQLELADADLSPPGPGAQMNVDHLDLEVSAGHVHRNGLQPAVVEIELAFEQRDIVVQHPDLGDPRVHREQVAARWVL